MANAWVSPGIWQALLLFSRGLKSMDRFLSVGDSAVAVDSVRFMYYLINRWHRLPLKMLNFPPCYYNDRTDQPMMGVNLPIHARRTLIVFTAICRLPLARETIENRTRDELKPMYTAFVYRAHLVRITIVCSPKHGQAEVSQPRGTLLLLSV